MTERPGAAKAADSQGGLLAEVIFRKLFFNLIFRGKVINRCVWLKKKKKKIKQQINSEN